VPLLGAPVTIRPGATWGIPWSYLGLLCNLCNVIFAMQSLLCSLCYAIFAILSLQCNLRNACSAIVALQSLLCNLCYAIFAMQSLLRGYHGASSCRINSGARRNAASCRMIGAGFPFWGHFLRSALGLPEATWGYLGHTLRLPGTSLQVLQCNLCNAIFAMKSLLCNLCYAIFAI
jgi:hypothetical protein